MDVNDAKQLQALSIRLLAFTCRRAKTKRWWLGAAGALAQGKTNEDIVCEAIGSLFGISKRRWDPQAQPDPWEYLKSTVNSLLSNLARNDENRRTSRGVEEDAAAAEVTPESELLRVEYEVRLRKRRARAYSSAAS